MANVLDTFVLELGLDPSKFTKGQKDALDSLRKMHEEALRTGKDVESQGKKIGEFFTGLKTMAVSAVAGAGFKDFVGQINNLDASLSRLSRTTGVSVEELSIWQGAVEQAGGKGADATASISAVADQINRLKSGLPASTEFMQLLNRFLPGVNIYTTKPTELILQLADAMQKAGIHGQQFATMMGQFPGMSQGMINALIQGRTHFEGLAEAARKTGVATKESGAAAEEYEQKLALLDRSAMGLWRSLVNFMGPALIATMEVLRSTLTLFRTVFDALPDLFKRLSDMPKAGSAEDKKAAEDLHDKLQERFGTPSEILDKILHGRSKSMDKALGVEPAVVPTQTPQPSNTAPAAMVPQPAIPFAPAGTTPITGERLTTITTAGGKRITIAESAAADFKGFLDELERRGAPTGSIGSFNIRPIAGTSTWSEHAKGRAIDMGSMTGRNQIDPALRAWIESHPAEWRDILARYKMKSGGDWKRPDLGHVEWKGAAMAAPPSGAAAAAEAGASTTINNRNRGDTTQTSTTNINGDIVVNTSAKDGDGIARDIVPALRNASFAAPFNSGLV